MFTDETKCVETESYKKLRTFAEFQKLVYGLYIVT